ncbi:MAG: hypothetical protein E7536_06605 [Ruminococcaceae bacterium]|nr:hypothetical protein [Oscillospiraceae bacterium]
MICPKCKKEIHDDYVICNFCASTIEITAEETADTVTKKADSQRGKSWEGPEDVIEYSVEYIYDSKNNVIKETVFEPDSSVRHWLEYEYKYDEQGNVTLKTEYFPDGSKSDCTTYEYSYVD